MTTLPTVGPSRTIEKTRYRLLQHVAQAGLIGISFRPNIEYVNPVTQPNLRESHDRKSTIVLGSFGAVVFYFHIFSILFETLFVIFYYSLYIYQYMRWC